MTEQRLDLRETPPPKRHPKIFETSGALDSGETLVIVTDHDPNPLYHRLTAEVESLDLERVHRRPRRPKRVHHDPAKTMN